MTETQDTRPDIQEDHQIWADVLALCNRYEDKELKNTMGALRIAECKLWLEDEEICFQFNQDNLNEHLIKVAKEILKPHRIILKNIFEKIAKKHINLDLKNWEEEVPF